MINKTTKLKPQDLQLFGLIVIIASVANILLKAGVANYVNFIDIVQYLTANYRIVLGYLLYLLPFALSILAYRKFKVSLVQSFASGVYIVTPLLAFVLGYEGFNLFKLIGVAFVACSILIIINANTK